MSILTNFLKLVKPEKNDYVDVEEHISNNLDKIDEKMENFNLNKLDKGGYTGTAQNLLTEISKIASKTVLGRMIVGKGLTVDSSGRTSVVSKNDGIIVNDNNIQLNVYDGVDSTSTTRAGSAKAVKMVYDTANAKIDKKGGDVTGNINLKGVAASNSLGLKGFTNNSEYIGSFSFAYDSNIEDNFMSMYHNAGVSGIELHTDGIDVYSGNGSIRIKDNRLPVASTGMRDIVGNILDLNANKMPYQKLNRDVSDLQFFNKIYANGIYWVNGDSWQGAGDFTGLKNSGILIVGNPSGETPKAGVMQIYYPYYNRGGYYARNSIDGNNNWDAWIECRPARSEVTYKPLIFQEMDIEANGEKTIYFPKAFPNACLGVFEGFAESYTPDGSFLSGIEILRCYKMDRTSANIAHYEINSGKIAYGNFRSKVIAIGY